MKIGIITLHNYNFGSVLQCFATQEYLEKKGVDSEVIDIAGSVNPLNNIVLVVWGLLCLCIRFPFSMKKIVKMFLSQRGRNLTLNLESVNGLQRFNNTFLHRVTYTKGHLKRLANSRMFDYFFSGSDQVWNGARIDQYDKFFLRFAPREKRVAWSASFGGDSIESYNMGRYKRYISEFDHLSVRENSGIGIVKELTGRNAVNLPDPVMLLTPGEWRGKAKFTPPPSPSENYILAFFIDKPSEKSKQAVEELLKQTGYSILSFGYKHDELAVTHYDGCPFDFLGYIDRAAYVLTDSFHAVAFATLFHTPFYVYERQYTHAQKQNTRLTDFLKETGLEDRFDGEVRIDEPISFEEADSYFEQKRKDADEYIKEITGHDSFLLEKVRMVRENKHDCCGCGACKDACGHKAIAMNPDETGAFYPIIDSSLCVECGLCKKVCSFKSIETDEEVKQYYIATSKDDALTSHSASGGIFALIAKRMIENGGVVYGAALTVENGIITCHHQKVENVTDLWRVQGSKYVQSATEGFFPDVKEELQSGRKVLFGGTSCQVAALKGYLRREYDNLITTDLICHGVPPVQLLQEYADMLARRYKETITDMKFRVRNHEGQPYQFTITTKNQQGENKKYSIGLRKSAYYRLFMSRAGYRSSCYSCPFASIHKPADITFGDYYLTGPERADKDMEAFAVADMLSSVVVHTEKGANLIRELDELMIKQNIPRGKMIDRHEQLKWPSITTRVGDNLYALYRERGMEAVQDAIDNRNKFLIISPLIKRIKIQIKRFHEKGENVSRRDEILSG